MESGAIFPESSPGENGNREEKRISGENDDGA